MPLSHLRQLQPLHYRNKYLGLIVIVIISLFLHSFFAWHQPFTNDEGAYLYDARILLEGGVPAGDVLTKAPVPILLFAVGEFFTGKSLFASRIINSIASIITVVPLFLLIQALANKRAAEIGAVLWLLGSGTIIFHTVGHTQAIASLFAVTCLWLFVAGIRSRKIIPKYVFLAGICFALAYASRKTTLAVAVPILLSLLVVRDVRGEMRKIGTMFLLGALAVIIPWFIWMYALYGFTGVWHAAGGGYGDILVNSKSITPWAGSADRMFSESVRMGLMYGALLLLICITVLRNHRVLIGASWIAVLAILYFLWPTHLVEYLADFIPAIVVAGAVSVAGPAARLHPTSAQSNLARSWGPRLTSPALHRIVLVILLLLNIASLRSVYNRPWTGMFTRNAVMQTAAWLRDNIPIRDEIFTAAVIIPYLSGHHVPFNLSHPQWYRYSFISQQDKNTFLPAYSDVQKVVDTRVSWVLRDQLTDYVYPDIGFNDLNEVLSVPNNTQYRQNPLRVYLKNEH